MWNKSPNRVKPRTSYRDPDLSDRWLREAEFRANREIAFYHRDAAKIILRLVKEVHRLNRMLGR